MNVIIDGLDGKVIVNPNEDEVKLYQKKKVVTRHKKRNGPSLYMKRQ